MSQRKRKEHDRYQRRYFDSSVDTFLLTIPKEVEDKTRSIVQAAHLDKMSRVLDVGTGCGVLIKHFLEEGLQMSNIAACDLSAKMLAEAKTRYPAATFWQGDIVDLPGNAGKFDAIFFNACFGNIYDQKKALSACGGRLSPGGKIVLSHPLGKIFVEKLHLHDAQLVPHCLPAAAILKNWASAFKLKLDMFQDDQDFYLAILSAA